MGEKFRKIKVYEGIDSKIAVFQKGNVKVEVALNEIDHVERLTTSPNKWLETRIVIPTGKRDDKGIPIYMVVRPKKAH